MTACYTLRKDVKQRIFNLGRSLIFLNDINLFNRAFENFILCSKHYTFLNVSYYIK